MEELLGGTDVERRALLLVERAQAHEVFPPAFERDALADEFDDVGGLEDQRFVIAAGIERHYASLSIDLWRCARCPEATLFD
jgi:hypothetical protein